MKPSMKRLAKDHVALRKFLPPNYFFENEEDQGLPDDLTQLLICLTGPVGTPFTGGLWRVRLNIPVEYPQKPPTATFTTRIFHPNVAEETGAVCLETLKRDWDQKLTLKDILLHISCLLIQPNPDSALNQKAGALIQDDYEAYSKQAQLMTRIHAPIPHHLTTIADAARRRGEEVSNCASDVLQENRPAEARGNSAKTVESERPLKRPLIESSEQTSNPAERRRKSPKRHDTSDDSTKDQAPTAEKDQPSQQVSDLPKKFIFRARWASAGVPKVPIGIRRL